MKMFKMFSGFVFENDIIRGFEYCFRCCWKIVKMQHLPRQEKQQLEESAVSVAHNPAQ